MALFWAKLTGKRPRLDQEALKERAPQYYWPSFEELLEAFITFASTAAHQEKLNMQLAGAPYLAVWEGDQGAAQLDF